MVKLYILCIRNTLNQFISFIQRIDCISQTVSFDKFLMNTASFYYNWYPCCQICTELVRLIHRIISVKIFVITPNKPKATFGKLMH